MMNRSELKEYAKAKVKGRRWSIWKGILYIAALTIIVDLIFPTREYDYETIVRYSSDTGILLDLLRYSILATVATSLFVSPLEYGFNQYLMDFDKEGEDTSTLFSYYGKMIKIFFLNVFIQIVIRSVTIVATILMIYFAYIEQYGLATGMIFLHAIGGFVNLYLTFCYAAVPFIFKECQDASIIDIMRESRQMMKGHKFEYFVLELSFVGWVILGIFTLGILYIWLAPYFFFTEAKYMLDLKNEYFNITSVEEEPIDTLNEEDNPYTIG